MRLVDAIKAFWSVLTGHDLVSSAQLEELKKTLETTKRSLDEMAKKAKKDRFAEGAVYGLLLLQREGRLIDFLQENIDAYQDAQIGAAVRSIHNGCSKVLTENFHIEPVMSEVEGSQVEISEGFDPLTVKLTGNVPDKGPYKGSLTHRGWTAKDPHFPSRSGKVNPDIIQAAEIQI